MLEEPLRSGRATYNNEIHVEGDNSIDVGGDINVNDAEEVNLGCNEEISYHIHIGDDVCGGRKGSFDRLGH